MHRNLLSSLLLGVGLSLSVSLSVAADEPEIGEPGIWTDWDTVLTADVDTGWVGVWRLKAAILRAGGKAIQFPLAGHTLSIDYHGNYRMDYATAHMLTASYTETPLFTGMTQWVPPAGLMPSGVPDSCALTGQISGMAAGRLFAPFDMDLDRLGPDGEVQYGLPWMEAAFDPSQAVRPQIVCPGADTDVTVKGGAAVLPVGAGRGEVTANGPVVPYDYFMNPELTTLVMVSRGAPSLTYIWTK